MSDWLGDPRQIEVERALGEFRAARPVEIVQAGKAALAFPAESLDEPILQHLASLGHDGARLVVSQARLHNRFGWHGGHGSLPLKAFGSDDLVALLNHEGHVHGLHDHGGHGKKSALPEGAAIRAPDALEEAALTLANLALLLPAVAVADASHFRNGLSLPVLSVNAASIEAFRDRESTRLHIVARTVVPLEGVDHAEFVVFRGGDGFRDHIAVVISNPPRDEPVLTRIHSACLTGDLFGSLKCDCGDQLRGTVRRMSQLGGGVVLYLDQEGRGNGIANKIRAYGLQAQGFDTYDADEILGFGFDQRRFDFAAEMLRQLGFRSVRLLTNNPQKIEALSEAGLELASTHRVVGRRNPHNIKYLAAKRDRAGHLLGEAASADDAEAASAAPLKAVGGS
jgi:GTP cyclohydrolase II